jgi:predicted nucleic acid-binding protein
MSDTVVDSSVVAKWVLPEIDSAQAHRLLTDIAVKGERLIILDLALVEVTNTIWKRFHRGLATLEEARLYLSAVLRCPATVQPAVALLTQAPEIAARYDCAVYDALFVALVQDLGLTGVTADEPLYRAVHGDFPQIILLRNWSPSL